MSIQIEVEKEQLWQDMAGRISRITDKLGMPIDPGIMDTVIVLNLLGIVTVQSCEGHIDHGIAAPWIFFTTSGIEELSDYEQVKQKHAKDQWKLLQVLEAFYANRQVSHSRMLFVHRLKPGVSILESQCARCQFIDSSEEKAEKKLKEYQEEMWQFTAFLKQKFFLTERLHTCRQPRDLAQSDPT